MKVFLKIPILILLIVFMSFAVVSASPDLSNAMRLYQAKNYKEALESFTDICRSSPNSSFACCYAANCYYALGQKSEAIDLYWYVVKTFPNSKEAYSCRTFLKQIDADYAKNSYSRNNVEIPKELTSSETVSKVTKESIEPGTIDSMIKVIKAEANRSDVSVDLIKEVKVALADYPISFLNLAKRNGTKIYLTPTMIDKEPGMQNTKPTGYEDGTTYKNCPGCFTFPNITVCAYILKGADDEFWEPSNDPIGTLRHELGHAFDSYMGWVSETEEFKHAYYLDSAGIDEETKNQLSYFLQKDRTGPCETFAELFCCKYGSSTIRKEHSTLVQSSFPRCNAILNKLIASMH